MKMEIHTYGDDVLREKAEPVGEVNEAIRALAKSMIETMHAENGVGLAAQQVGRTEAVCVVEVPPEYDADEQGSRFNPDVQMPLVLVNPEIVEASKEQETAEEGCLSFPGIYAPVKRPVEVLVRFLDLGGKSCELRLKKFVARAVQHEMDHLNGVLLVDRMSSVKRIALRGQLKRMKNETREALGIA
jgi:peptide deformylase